MEKRPGRTTMRGKLHIVRTAKRKPWSFYIGAWGIEAILNLLPGRFGFCVYYAWHDAPRP